MLKTKEQLLQYFMNHLRLSTYDHKFINKLESLILQYHWVTTNQKTLFEKLIFKYRKQLEKVGVSVDELLSLPWKAKIVESSPERTGAQVSLVKDTIELKVPFNKNFIGVFRNIENNTFEWDRSVKFYKSPFSTNALKILISLLPKYFNHIVYDSAITELIKNAEEYNANIWNPTLVCVNGYYMIAAINNNLYDKVKDIELNDDFKTLFKLSTLGIKIDEKIIDNDEKKKFASLPIIDVEVSDLIKALNWLKELNIEKVFYGLGLNIDIGHLMPPNDTLKKHNANETFVIIKNNLKKLNIDFSQSHAFFKDTFSGDMVMIQTISKMDSIFYQDGRMISKYIILRDSRPIDIK